jgi:hypothetical protein
MSMMHDQANIKFERVLQCSLHLSRAGAHNPAAFSELPLAGNIVGALYHKL